MKWILFWFVLGCILANCVGCANNRLTIVANSVQSDVDIQARYELEW